MAIAFIQTVEGKKGTIYKAHYTDPLTGKRRCKSPTRHKDAQAFLLSPKVTGNTENKEPTVAEAVDYWIKVCETSGRNGREPVARSTLKQYWLHARYIKQAMIDDDGARVNLGDILLSKLTLGEHSCKIPG
jgi:integrase